MGMDVIGMDPQSETGSVFLNNNRWWLPLASYCEMVAPEITINCDYWYSNDGDGLNAEDSIKLADALQREIDNGGCARHAKKCQENVDPSPVVPCVFCKGTGEADSVPIIKCLRCGGSGRTGGKPIDPFAVENVQRFVDFLRSSGGFQIW